MTEERFPNWDRLPNGDIRTAPVVSWEIGPIPMNVLLRFEVLEEGGGQSSVQIHIPATRARELAEALSRISDRALTSEPTLPS
jgi:hypothetical protein